MTSKGVLFRLASDVSDDQLLSPEQVEQFEQEFKSLTAPVVQKSLVDLGNTVVSKYGLNEKEWKWTLTVEDWNWKRIPGGKDLDAVRASLEREPRRESDEDLGLTVVVDSLSAINLVGSVPECLLQVPPEVRSLLFLENHPKLTITLAICAPAGWNLHLSLYPHKDTILNLVLKQRIAFESGEVVPGTCSVWASIQKRRSRGIREYLDLHETSLSVMMQLLEDVSPVLSSINEESLDLWSRMSTLFKEWGNLPGARVTEGEGREDDLD
jgi:hypothetical protein